LNAFFLSLTPETPLLLVNELCCDFGSSVCFGT
jgi:hypothetical protein